MHGKQADSLTGLQFQLKKDIQDPTSTLNLISKLGVSESKLFSYAESVAKCEASVVQFWYLPMYRIKHWHTHTIISYGYLVRMVRIFRQGKRQADKWQPEFTWIWKGRARVLRLVALVSLMPQSLKTSVLPRSWKPSTPIQLVHWDRR